MKRIMVAVALSAFLAPAFAAKDCAELKSEIEAKIQSHGVKSFTLEIVEKGKGGEAKVVGSCEAGTKEITYVRQ